MGIFLRAVRAKLFELFAVDPRSLAFYRVCLSSLLLLTYFNFIPYIGDYFSDQQIVGRSSALYPTSALRMSLYLVNGHPYFPHLVLGLSILAALMLLVGVYTRCAAVASLLFFNSLTVSTDSMSFGLHHATNCLLAWTVFLPFHRIPRWVTSSSKGSRFFSLSAFGLMMTALTIGVGAGLVKLRRPDFWFFQADALYQFSTYYTNRNFLTHWILEFPAFGRLLTRLTPLIEIGIVPAMFVPFYNATWRIAALTGATIFFLMASLSIHVGLFPLVPLIAMYVYIPSYVWDWILDRPFLRRLLDPISDSVLERTGRKMFDLIQRLNPLTQLRRLGFVIAALFVTAFVLNIWNNYCPVNLRFVPSWMQQGRLAERVLELSSLNRGWDFMYGGPMHNRFLVAEYVVSDRSFLRNITYVRYRWPMYNYEMNYANKVLNDRSNGERMNRYMSYLCRRGDDAQFFGQSSEVRLYEIQDDSNLLGAFTDRDQAQLASALKKSVPFARFNCLTRGFRSSPQLPSPVTEPLTLEQFPIFFWEQGFGVLRFNSSVDGNPLRLGEQTYTRGLGTHANSVIRVAVSGARRFRVLAGIDGERASSSQASTVVEVYGDERLLYRSPLLNATTPPVLIDIPLHGVSTMTLVALADVPGGNMEGIVDDHVDWVDPQFE